MPSLCNVCGFCAKNKLIQCSQCNYLVCNDCVPEVIRDAGDTANSSAICLFCQNYGIFKVQYDKQEISVGFI